MASSEYVFMKERENDVIWWVESPIERDGEFLFSFDRKTVFNLFADYPWKLTKEQKETFDRENPHWRDFFADRQ